MDHADLPEIKDTYRRDVTLRLLENQENFLKEAAPTVSAGVMPDTGGVAKWDPILIALVRRAMPQMIAYDVCGVQPMSGPTGLIFAMRSKYDGFTGAGAAGEAFGALGTAADEADTGHSEANAAATSAHTVTTSSANPFTGTWNTGDGMTTANAEALGDAANNAFSEMAFTIEKSSVTAVSRALKAEYSTELAQDLKAVHGLDAETELANILSTEILQEINREVIRTIYYSAKRGASVDTETQYTFDLDTDSNGRWSVEKFKGLLYQIERDRNEIGHTTRRGRGNFVICSADVASALAMAGVLDYAPAIDTNIKADDTMSTFAGTMNGMKVYVDPYYTSEVGQMYVVGYKGSSSYDAGMFYCPYVPLQMVRA
ncbi:MAG: ATP-binding protein, partial [Chloroflexota bacterium]|nr:ATP-binding protein [Chloroflexota bacterium]